jgi:hypothetical protein
MPTSTPVNHVCARALDLLNLVLCFKVLSAAPSTVSCQTAAVTMLSRAAPAHDCNSPMTNCDAQDHVCRQAVDSDMYPDRKNVLVQTVGAEVPFHTTDTADEPVLRASGCR